MNEIRTIGIAGAGTMGAGIAIVCARAGFHTRVFDLKQDAQVVYWGGTVPVFNNAGVLRKTGGAAQGYFDWSIVNSGSVQQNSGTLNLRQGGTLSSSWSVGTGATLALA